MTPVKRLAALGYWLGAYCRSCQRNADIDPAPLVPRYGEQSFKDLEPRLRCSVCGAKGPRLWMYFHG